MKRTVVAKGKLKGAQLLAPAADRRGLWGSHCARLFPNLARATHRLLCAHATTAAAERTHSVLGQIYTPKRNNLVLAKGLALGQIMANHYLLEEEDDSRQAAAACLLQSGGPVA